MSFNSSTSRWPTARGRIVGRNAESEWELARGLLSQLPKGALWRADRLYGGAAFEVAALAAGRRVGSHFLFRARGNGKRRVLKRFKDGSRLLRVPGRQKGNPNRITQWLEGREIRARVGRQGHRSQELRLWTQAAGLAGGPSPGMGPIVCATVGTRIVVPATQAPVAPERSAPKSQRRDGGAGNRGAGLGQRAVGRRAGAGRGRSGVGVTGELCQRARSVATLVVDAGVGRRPAV